MLILIHDTLWSTTEAEINQKIRELQAGGHTIVAYSYIQRSGRTLVYAGMEEAPKLPLIAERSDSTLQNEAQYLVDCLNQQGWDNHIVVLDLNGKNPFTLINATINVYDDCQKFFDTERPAPSPSQGLPQALLELPSPILEQQDTRLSIAVPDALRRKAAVSVKPDVSLDQAHKSASTVARTISVINILTTIPATQLRKSCQEEKTYNDLTSMRRADREGLAHSKISIARNNAINAGNTIDSTSYNKAIKTELEAINNTAFAVVIGDQVAIIANEIARLTRLIWIDEHSELIQLEYVFQTEIGTYYGTYLREKVRELNGIIEGKLALYINGPYANKTEDDIKNELAALEALRTALINVDYKPSEESDLQTNNEAFLQLLARKVSEVKAQNMAGFGKHGRLAFLSVGFATSKAEKFSRELINPTKGFGSIPLAIDIGASYSNSII